MNTVQVTRKSVYGRDMLYPYNNNAKQFASLVNKRTLGNFELARIRSLGFVIEVVAENGAVVEVLD